MKIAIVSVGDYRHISMISKYTEYFDSHGIAYDILCTNRYKGTVFPSSNIKAFSCGKLSSKKEKLRMFLSFYRWARKIIRQERYDFLVIWNENTAPLFAPLLLTTYRKRYCVNIRDVDFLNQSAVNIVRKLVINASAFSTYCSTAKLDFPKGYPYVLMRSINMKILKDTQPRDAFRAPGEKLRVVNIGKIRFPLADKKIIEALGDDERFELFFIGAGSEKLEPAAKKYQNVHLIGTYLPEETAGFLANADLIDSYFGTTVLGYERMNSIRFSYGPYLRIPVLVGAGTEMEAEGNKYGFVFAVKEDFTSFADDLYNWYRARDFEAFSAGCGRYLEDIRKTDEIFYARLEETIARCEQR
ncbi:MAG: hypothetical protein IJK64_04735 [Clostridia bacterium]|nr:hypothetical protein [Clostridia bacterium]